ncbi:MAG: trypsin-like peptidase domain-containing protein [Hormoscilla sp. GUM202]|nr:trypsin-like peptidase domain-containing protein [Hormoscilla sp. GUM202]
MQLDKLLQQCTLRLSVAGDRGTGFFVAPGWILTCAHTVKKAGNLPVDLFWQDRNYKAIIEKCQAETYLDWAVLRLEDPVP